MSGQRMRGRVFTVFFTGLLALAACSFEKPAVRPDDKAITTEIQAQLFQDSVLKARDIRVVTQNGAVVMTGTVGTELEKAATLRIAQKTPGVQQVIDQLTVGEPSMASLTTAEASAPASELAAAPAPVAQPRAPAPAARSTARDQATAPRVNRPAVPPAESSAPEAVAASRDAEAPATTQIAQAETPPTPPPVHQPESFTIPSGTIVTVRTIDRIDSSRNQAGDEFAATVESPVVVGDRVVIPRSSDARLRLVDSRTAGRMTGRSELQVELTSVTVDGVSYPVQSGVYEQRGSSRSTRTAETVGGGAALGALIGAIAGRGKGAAIGAAVGAGSGAAVQAVTHGEQVKVPPETKLDFTLRAPLTVEK